MKNEHRAGADIRESIHRSSTYVFSSPEDAADAFSSMPNRSHGSVYARFDHANAKVVERHLSLLEPGASATVMTNSGMAAAMTALFTVLRPGDGLVHTTPLYIKPFIENFIRPFGIQAVPVPAGDPHHLERAILETPNLRAVLIETPANPTMVLTDIRRTCDVVAESGRQPRPVVLVDNTLLGPVFQHPLLMGADACIYSATKYLGGHSDLLAGAVVTRDEAFAHKLRRTRTFMGNILQADQCASLLTRLETLQLRMERQNRNAAEIAEFLSGHFHVESVLYPALFRDPDQMRIRDAQTTGTGGIVSLNLPGGRSDAFNLLRRLRVIRNAVSLGGTETLACHPRTTTHSGYTSAELDHSGIGEGLVRFSIGIEPASAIISDLRQALQGVGASQTA